MILYELLELLSKEDWKAEVTIRIITHDFRTDGNPQVINSFRDNDGHPRVVIEAKGLKEGE
jgi:hypothetical protein